MGQSPLPIFRVTQRGVKMVFFTQKHTRFFKKESIVNTVLQSTAVVGHGSYSVFAQKNNLDYISVEVTKGDIITDKKSILFGTI